MEISFSAGNKNVTGGSLLGEIFPVGEVMNKYSASGWDSPPHPPNRGNPGEGKAGFC